MTHIRSTIPDFPLTIRGIFEHGERIYRASEVATCGGDQMRRASYAQVGERVRRLAGALGKLGIGAGDRVGTFAWNNQEHLEAYYAVPSMGAVLHCINIRLFPDQLVYIVNHAADRIVIVDGSLTPLLAKIAGQLTTVERYIVPRSRCAPGRKYRKARRRPCATPAALRAIRKAWFIATAPRGCTPRLRPWPTPSA